MSDIENYLRTITAGQREGLIEVRYRAGTTMHRRFIAARRIQAAAAFIRKSSERSDVYVGVAPRARRGGGKSAITHSHLVWAELDHGNALERIAALVLPASMIVSSGSGGHAHAYWRLSQPLSGPRVEELNQRLALALDADQHSTDYARILRPPKTLNWKHTPPRAVTLIRNTPRTYSPGELDAALPDLFVAAALAPHRPATAATHSLAHELRSIPARDYVHTLSGRTPNRDNKIACPFHEDTTPSLHVYEQDWYCYGCGAGGSVIDFASLLWLSGQSPDAPLRGRQFVEVRQRLLTVFFGDDVAA